jgi:hypothetical protein
LSFEAFANCVITMESGRKGMDLVIKKYDIVAGINFSSEAKFIMSHFHAFIELTSEAIFWCKRVSENRIVDLFTTSVIKHGYTINLARELVIYLHQHLMDYFRGCEC